jgi:hypothetical protein
MKLVLTPHFKMPSLGEIVIYDQCGCRGGAGQMGGGVTETPQVPEYIPAAGDCPPCSALFVQWEKLTEDWKRLRTQEDLARSDLKNAEQAEAAARLALERLLSDPNQASGKGAKAARERLEKAVESVRSARKQLAEREGKWQPIEEAASVARGKYEVCKSENCPPVGGDGIDPCLVGTWRSVEAKLQTKFGNWSGGSGFTIVIKKDGTLNADYTAMVPVSNTTDKVFEEFIYSGTASGLITTKDKVATVRSILNKNVGLRYTINGSQMFEYKAIPSLGPGGLGSTAGENGYVCTDTSLEFKASSGSIGGKTDFALKLSRIK